MHAFQMKTTKSIVKPKVKGGHNLEPDIERRIKGHIRNNSRRERKLQKLVGTQEVLAQGQSIMAEQVSDN
jgi:hypothetical protein